MLCVEESQGICALPDQELAAQTIQFSLVWEGQVMNSEGWDVWRKYHKKEEALNKKAERWKVES